MARQYTCEADPLAELKAQKLAMLSAGQEVLDLVMINPDFAPPQLLLDKLMEAAAKPGLHRYSVSRGIKKLREAFAEKYLRAFNVSLSPDRQTCVTLGMKDALYQALRCLTKSGDTVLLPSPTYPAYLSALAVLGLSAQTYDLAADEDEMLMQLRERILSAAAKVLILNFPNNPTGWCVSSAFLQEAVAVALSGGCFVINDFVYGELTYSGQPPASLLKDNADCRGLAEIYSLSKAYNIPGWRVAALLGDEKLIERVARLKEQLDYGLFLPMQLAAAAGLTAAHGLSAATAVQYKRRISLLERGLSEIGFAVSAAKAGACVWAKLPAASGYNGAFEFAGKLMRETGIVVMPGSLFGEKFDRHVRLAAVAPEEKLREALEKISEFCALKGAIGALALFLFVFSCLSAKPALAVSGESCVQASVLLRQGSQRGDGSPEEEKLYRDALALCPQMAEARYNLGVVLSRQGKRQEAQQELKKAIELRATPRFLVASGVLELELQNLSEAQAAFERALSMEAKDIAALQGLSVVYERTGQRAKAVDTLRKASEIAPNDPLTHYNMGVLFEKSGDTLTAIDQFEAVLRLNERHGDAHFRIGIIYKEASRLDEARNHLKRAVELLPDFAPAKEALGIVYAQLGDEDQAENLLRRALNNDSTRPSLYIALGIVLLRKEQPALAESLLLEALAKHANNPEIHETLGQAQEDLGKYSDAEKSFRQALLIDALRASTHKLLAGLYQKMGRSADAEVELRKVESLARGQGA